MKCNFYLLLFFLFLNVLVFLCNPYEKIYNTLIVCTETYYKYHNFIRGLLLYNIFGYDYFYTEEDQNFNSKIVFLFSKNNNDSHYETSLKGLNGPHFTPLAILKHLGNEWMVHTKIICVILYSINFHHLIQLSSSRCTVHFYCHIALM